MANGNGTFQKRKLEPASIQLHEKLHPDVVSLRRIR